MGTFNRFNSNRDSINMAKAVNSPGSSVTTGDITRGEIITVDLAATNEGTASVAPRRTGAVLISTTGGFADYQWSISGTTLTVGTSASVSTTFTFWVF